MAFDVEKFARTAAPVRWDDIDLRPFDDQPLSDASLRVLRYMCDIESHTVCYPRDMLVTPSHADPEVSTFLTMWNYEEHWHGEVLADVLAAHGSPPVRTTSGTFGRASAGGPGCAHQAVGPANLVGEDFIARHMSWGAINEWLTDAGYTARTGGHATGPAPRRLDHRWSGG